MIEQRRQVWIVSLVINDESGVDRCRPLIRWSVNRIRMAADPVVFFVNRYPMRLIKKPCRGHSGDPGPDDSNAQTAIMSGGDGVQFILSRLTICYMTA